MVNDEYIISKFIGGNKLKRVRKDLFSSITKEEEKYLLNRYNDSFSLDETVKRIYLNIEEHPKCPVCGNYVNYIGSFKHMYHHYCSKKCSTNSKETKSKIKATCIERYGVESYSKSNQYKNNLPEYKRKFKESMIKRYGVEYASQSSLIRQKIRSNCLLKYGVPNGGGSSESIDKIKRTCQIRYGTDTYFNSDDFLMKKKESMKNKYGVLIPLQNEEIKEKAINTCKSKYGVDNVLQLKENQLKRKKTLILKYGVEYTLQNKELRERATKGVIDKYGVDTYFKSKEYKEKIPNYLEKIYNTKRKNHTFNTSKAEEELYLYIKEKFPDVKRQYRDKERYPWHCDFYLPSLDYFIELQGYYTHGKHPFDFDSKEDNLLVEQYKKRYGPECQAITIWTIKDVEKRECAKKHNLNFKEVWTLEEGKEFIDEL